MKTGSDFFRVLPAFSLVSAYHCQSIIGPWPMHEVVPRAVRAAVRIDTMT